MIAERLRPVRDPARPPLFQTMLVFQRARPEDPEGLAAFSLGEEGARLELGGLALEAVRLPERRGGGARPCHHRAPRCVPGWSRLSARS
jgi:hypothetical protein